MGNKYAGKVVYQGEMEELRTNHKKWKEERRSENTPFFMIYKDFKDLYLKDISGGALKLYVYLGFHVNSFTGECWVSTENIAEFFGNDQRTIKKWIAELEEIGLLKRIQNGFKRVANSFLLPYTKETESGIETSEGQEE